MADDCQGCIPQTLVRRAFLEEKSGKEVLRKLDERLAEDNLLKTQLPLIRCPFCTYAEIDELYLPEGDSKEFQGKTVKVDGPEDAKLSEYLSADGVARPDQSAHGEPVATRRRRIVAPFLGGIA